MSKYSGTLKSGTFFRPLYRNGEISANLWNHRFGFRVEVGWEEESGREYMDIYLTEGYTTCPKQCQGGEATIKSKFFRYYEDNKFIDYRASKNTEKAKELVDQEANAKEMEEMLKGIGDRPCKK